MDDNTNIFSIDLKIDLKEDFVLFKFFHIIKYQKCDSSRSAKRMKFFKKFLYKTKKHRIVKNYKRKFKMNKMIFAVFYVQKQRHVTNLVSNETYVEKNEIKILRKEILKINAKITSFSSFEFDKA